ncbi:TonB-dependent receptor [Chitinophaga agrisoli]|uniref:TonB-dependent receptor n=1 Tax=Chitinophaga agrisoli TaxID=2607653 RepID=A0A5B2W3N1_9BACT|nr:TonB-dependent receptor [Chitinophaga agrisoli]KAA2245146.1 TonB-dependent receptor [Chitinophaga agrisoli]
MRRLYSLLMGSMLMLMFQFAYAQQKTITGTVTDAKDGSLLPGVTVKAKGTAVGTVTGANGSYTINVPGNTNTLVFTFVGYGDQEVAIAGQSTINASLSTGNKELSEVVVVGYGTQSKRELTGSVAKVNAKEIENFPAPSFESAIQGKAAGVVIESGSGKVGQGMKIRIRGTSSISASSQPLYVIDGLPMQTQSQSDGNNEITNPVADLNPNDIESIEVLKDAAATAIYGARAANGVVLVTTKKGKAGQKTVVSLDMNTSWGKPTKKRHFLDAKQYVDLIEEAATNDGKIDFKNGDTGYDTEEDAIADYKSFYEGYLDQFALGTDWRNQAVNTNWENLLYRPVAHGNSVNLSASGGNEKTRFYASGYYNDQDAIVIVNRFKRYGGRLNLEHSATDRLSLGLNLSVSRSELIRVSDDNSFSTPGQLVAQVPISPTIDPETGKLNKRTLYDNGLVDAALNSDKQSTFRSIGNAYANYTFLPWLAFRSEFGADVMSFYQESFIGKEATDGGGVGKASNFSTQAVSYNTNNYFTITPSIGEHHKLSAVVGMSYLQNDNRSNALQGEQYPTDAIKNLTGATLITFGGSTNDRYNFLSYFGRANYAYKDKYLVSASVRTDGSSRFSANHRYGTFPAASVGWVASQEDFLKHSKVLSYLKIRASYGLTGNAEIGEYKYQSLYNVTNYPDLPGFVPVQLANPDLQWEKTSQADAGVEFGFFGGRLSGEVDVYSKKTTDLLLNVNVPSATGYSFITRNLGKMTNKGVELSLNSVNIDGAVRWTTSFNIAYNKNKITDLDGQIIESGEQRAVEGEAIGSFFLQKYLGVDPETGDALYEDKDGKQTTDYSQAARKVVGNSNPNFTGGLNNTVTYKGFDLGAFFTFVQGNEIFNRAGVYQSNSFGGAFDNQTTEILRRWQKPGDHTDIPRVSLSYPTGENVSSRWIYNGSYIRLKTLTLGYTLPKVVTSTLKISSARLYVSAYNLWTKTDYISDPEVNTAPLGVDSQTSQNISGGIDFYTIPQARQFLVGVNVKF